MNIAFTDQLGAAIRDTHRAFAALTDNAENRPMRIPEHAPAAAWLTGALRTVADLAEAGHGLSCLHITGRSPQPVVWTAHQPDALMCMPCAEVIDQAVRDTAAESVCSCCGRYSPNTAVAVTGAGKANPLTTMFTLCRRCRTEP